MVNRTISLLPEDEFDKRFKGITLPIDKKPGGFFQKQYTRQIIRSSILDILKTRRGERVMLPAYGSDLSSLIFDPNDNATLLRVRRMVTSDLARWEPRIRIRDVVLNYPTGSTHRLYIRVTYEILSISEGDAVTLVLGEAGTSR